MLSYEDALQRVLLHARPLSVQPVALGDALNQVLAEDIFAPISLPPFANSQMDGYALRFIEWTRGQRVFPVAGTIAAGDSDVPALPPGRALRVMTGAPLPFGADTVIPIEDTDGGLETVHVHNVGVAGQYIRQNGEDIRTGELALSRESLLRPAHIGLLAALGLDRVSVHRAPPRRPAFYRG